jgi:hypothetical protein
VAMIWPLISSCMWWSLILMGTVPHLHGGEAGKTSD